MSPPPLRIDRLSQARALFAGLARAEGEVAGVAYLGVDAQVVGLRLIAGGADQVSVPPRTLTLDALAFGAEGVIVAHNHPSGDPAPSRHDLDHARSLARALALMDVRLVDHLIVTAHATTSLRAMGVV
ncbi:JAB domain-containing protein [uncultured Sphingomonas sp.]|uniref:JAB domain-containing protein n=1 Tax=uncultured Sphingomonas sp. TaxID=158754 RepID=UPI0025F88718|nr:JAB domain-containing protein [uncultured Sphingomonas sp.]